MKTGMELAWLAGILEGEGSFMTKKGCAKIALQMTDKDVVEKVAVMLGTKLYGDSWKPKGKDSYLPVWTCSVHGTNAISWMMTLYSQMGQRRRQKIKEILNAWTDSKAAPRASRGTRFMATCHPEKPRVSEGLCMACYMRGRRKQYKANDREKQKQQYVVALLSA